MVKTIVLLLATIILVPLLALYFDKPFNEVQWQMIKQTGMVMLVAALLCFVVSELTKNCSQVDKLWSILPIVYTWMYAAISQWDARLVLMALLATVWGVRLTYNFSRRGAYRIRFWEGEEDYRWEVLRQKPFLQGVWRWRLFNLGFISLYQNTLIWLFTLPAVVAFTGDAVPLGVGDVVLALLFVGLVIMETIADQQQWNFHKEKLRRKHASEEPGDVWGKGFVHTGLWKWVRHPNYTAEQTIWIVFYFFSAVATGRWLNASMVGALLLLLLFQGSSDFSESISLSKYPEYADYKKRTPRFLPF